MLRIVHNDFIWIGLVNKCGLHVTFVSVVSVWNKFNDSIRVPSSHCTGRGHYAQY